MHAALGVGSVRPSSIRTWAASAALIRVQVPLSFHLAKYSYTVCQGVPRSLGSIRHWHPVRFRYRMLLITERKLTVRGAPAPVNGGSSGSTMSHSVSLMSVE